MECSFCLKNLNTESNISLQCQHSFHNSCLSTWTVEYGKTQCIICRREIDNRTLDFLKNIKQTIESIILDYHRNVVRGSTMISFLILMTIVYYFAETALYADKNKCLDNRMDKPVYGVVTNFFDNITTFSYPVNKTCKIATDQVSINVSYLIYVSNIDTCSFSKFENKCDTTLIAFNVFFTFTGGVSMLMCVSYFIGKFIGYIIVLRKYNRRIWLGWCGEKIF